jgi:hypothetical protein
MIRTDILPNDYDWIIKELLKKLGYEFVCIQRVTNAMLEDFSQQWPTYIQERMLVSIKHTHKKGQKCLKCKNRKRP